MTRRLAFPLVLLALLGACARKPEPPADQPEHPLLRGLPEPPLNRPIAPVAARPGQEPRQLPPGDAPALLVLRGGQPFTGMLSATGNITLEANRVRVQPDTGAALEILYRFPRTLSVPGRGASRGSVALVVRSTPAAADQRLVVLAGGRLALGEIWQQQAQPITFALGNTLRLVQGSAQPGAGQYGDAPVRVVEGERTLATLAIGQPTVVQSRTGVLRVLVEVSQLFTPAPTDADQVRGGYILRAWVVPGG